MSKWKCEICGKEFDNFHAQGFDNKIYCPLCFFKEDNRRLKDIIDEVREHIEKNLSFCENDSQGAYDVCNIRMVSDRKLLQILDKVKEVK